MDIRARILARSDLDQMRAARDITGLAAALNAEKLEVRAQRFITARAILTTHPVEGRDILKRLRAAAGADIGVEFAVRFLEQEAGLDIGDEATWRDIDGLVANSVLTEAQGVLLKHLAMRPVVVTQEQVAISMYNPDGTEK